MPSFCLEPAVAGGVAEAPGRAELLAKLARGLLPETRGHLLEGTVDDSGPTGVFRSTGNIHILLESDFQQEVGLQTTEEKPQQRRVLYLFYTPKK